MASKQDEEEEDDQSEPVRDSPFLNGATYVKTPAKGPEIVIEPGTLEAEQDPESPAADPQFAYPTASGKVTIPGKELSIFDALS